MNGAIILYFALVATIVAAFFYTSCCFKESRRPYKLRIAGTAFLTAGISTGLAAAVFLVNILTDQFQFAYVYNYSSVDLPLAYKFSVLWAGQEGSFFFWLACHAGIGLILQRQPATVSVMAVYCVLQNILLLILLAQNPFRLLLLIPADGAGLNLLLQDPWMVIHPPLVLLGYAGFAAPLAFAVGSLLDNEPEMWPVCALPWSLFSWACLSAGIFIGGFWAYKVLGWGGYWAWDPVENSSLVPWLFAGAFIHVLLVAARKKAGIKAAYVLAIFTFVMVLYGTFLTRSGILSAFSVHSFADEGIGGLFAILLPLIAFGAFTPLIIRWPGLTDGRLMIMKNRETLLMAGALALVVFALLVFIGMSTPLITLLFNQPHAIGADFYNTSALPVAAAIMLLIALAPLVKWGKEDFCMRTFCRIGIPGFVSAIFFGQLLNVSHFVLFVIGAAGLAGFCNIMFLRRRITLPVAFAHIGIAAMTVGILVSSAGNQSQIVAFTPGQTQSVLGAEITYQGVEHTATAQTFRFNLQVDNAANQSVQSLTKLNKSGRPAASEPGIYREWNSDLYLAQRGNFAGQENIRGQIAVEVSRKPFIGLVWLGAVMTTLAIGWSGLRRMQQTGNL